MAREMRYSGIEWIGEIPRCWHTSKLKYLGRYINGYAFKPEDWGSEGIPIIRIQDLTGSTDRPNFFSGKIDDKYLVKNGDILVSWAATLDAFVWNKGTGWLNQHIFKAVPNEEKIDYSYFFWMIKESMKNMNNDNKHGIFMQHVTLDVFNNFSIPMPPLEEQRKIASFLDRKCAEIDSVIADTQRTIEEYKKLKQSVITQAVTKGIRGERPMKDSGIEWIGEIPEEWNTVGLKFLCSMQSGKNITSEMIADEGAYPVYGGNGLRGYYSEYNTEGEYLLVGRQGALCGNVHHVSGQFWATEHAVVTTPTALANIDFLHYLLIGMNLNQYANNTAAQPGLAVGQIQNVRTCFVPLAEQQEIASYLNKKCAEIDNLIAAKTHLLGEIEAYKKSIIYEYVTGKKEVPACQ